MIAFPGFISIVHGGGDSFSRSMSMGSKRFQVVAADDPSPVDDYYYYDSYDETPYCNDGGYSSCDLECPDGFEVHYLEDTGADAEQCCCAVACDDYYDYYYYDDDTASQPSAIV